MNRTTAAAALLVAVIVATAAIWFFLNQTNALDETNNPNETNTPDQTNNPNEVRVTAFSVDPEGWKDPPDSWVACLFNITIENTGTNDVQGLWLKVTMFSVGENVGDVKAGAILGVNGDLRDFTLYIGEVRSFQGEMHGGATLESLHRSPVGATYLAQVVLGSSNVLDEAECEAP
jgi:hypothetical protein